VANVVTKPSPWSRPLAIATGAGLLLMLTSAGVLATQGMLWFGVEQWVDVRTKALWLALGGTEPALAWKSVEQILRWMLDQPLSLSLFEAGFTTVLLPVFGAPR
jgi:hypothetical protein